MITTRHIQFLSLNSPCLKNNLFKQSHAPSAMERDGFRMEMVFWLPKDMEVRNVMERITIHIMCAIS